MRLKKTAVNLIKINIENPFLKFAKMGENIFIKIKVTDLNTIKVGLIERSFEAVNEVESISVSSETASFYLLSYLREEQ